MEIVRRKVAGVEVVSLFGQVSGAEVPRLAGEFQAIRATTNLAKPSKVVLDVSALDNLPSAVIGSLVEAIRALEAFGGRLVLAGPNHPLAAVLARLGIGELVSHFKTTEEAIQALAAPPVTTVEDLRAPADGGRKDPAIAPKSAKQDTATFRQIRAEFSQVGEMISHSKQADERHQELIKSIEDAGRQQREMLPDLPGIAGYEFEILFRPMATISGDFYDFFKVSPNETGIVLGDVSGHGVEAGIVMSMVKKVLKIRGRGQSSPAEVLRITNADVFEDLAQSTFASVSYGVLDTAARTLRFARAGHTPLLIYNPARQPELSVLEPKGIVLGADRGPVFDRELEEAEVKLLSGDVLVQVTDGVLEAANAEKEQFGIGRLRGTVQKYGNREAKYLVHMIELAVGEFRAACPAEDDVTIVCVKVA
jgi:serine phosphatase RsbU (regulator of sigma subunit)/anti-anti-sigma regulatory factor